MKKHINKIELISFISLIFLILLNFFVSDYKENKCIEIEKENLRQCLADENSLKEDCYQYKQAIEEYCLGN